MRNQPNTAPRVQHSTSVASRLQVCGLPDGTESTGVVLFVSALSLRIYHDFAGADYSGVVLCLMASAPLCAQVIVTWKKVPSTQLRTQWRYSTVYLADSDRVPALAEHHEAERPTRTGYVLMMSGMLLWIQDQLI